MGIKAGARLWHPDYGAGIALAHYWSRKHGERADIIVIAGQNEETVLHAQLLDEWTVTS